MRTELVLAGYKLNMRSRKRRKTLVIVVYTFLIATLSAAFMWEADGLGSSVCVLFLVALINRVVFGGLTTRGLVRPFFSGIRPIWFSDDPPPVSSIDRWFWRRSSSRKDLQTDERDNQRRDRAHSSAYRCLTLLTYVVWGLFAMVRMGPVFGARGLPFDFALVFALATAMLALTLPQAILLWTEPDMDPDLKEAQ